jgi:hypothetical protein
MQSAKWKRQNGQRIGLRPYGARFRALSFCTLHCTRILDKNHRLRLNPVSGRAYRKTDRAQEAEALEKRAAEIRAIKR